MYSLDGLSLSNHQGFKKIQNEEHKDQFTCQYIHTLPQVHSKAHIWLKNKQSYRSFIGSANYTQNAFYSKQPALLKNSQDASILNYFADLEGRSIDCNHHELENYIKIFKRNKEMEYNPINPDSKENSLKTVTVALFSEKEGQKYVPERSGLNWGQRPEAKREANQAYLQLPPEVYKSDFFPVRSQHFTLKTDDGYTLICTRAQKSEEGQAIHTTHNNSLLGEYFRRRLGIANGQKVTMNDLQRYGRDEVRFHKIDDENFYMDFSNNASP